MLHQPVTTVAMGDGIEAVCATSGPSATANDGGMMSTISQIRRSSSSVRAFNCARALSTAS